MAVLLRTCPPIPPSFGFAQDRAFWHRGLRWQTCLHFAAWLAAESAGGSIIRHAVQSSAAGISESQPE